jgi:RNA polymerase sigma-70 factor, ECF subfamily
MARGPMALVLAFPASADPREQRSLVDRLRAGDAAALGEAYDLHNVYVRAFARTLVGDDAIAEDVVQEAFVALPRATRRFDEGSTLRTFLIGIVVNHARHAVRAAARRRAMAERFAAQPAAASTTPEADMRHRQLAEALSRALDALPLAHRVAFVLCELQELSAVECAALLDIPEATVRTRVFNAKRKLRAWFEHRGIR